MRRIAAQTTDANGRYTLSGFPKGKSYGLMVLTGEKAPYFVSIRCGLIWAKNEHQETF